MMHGFLVVLVAVSATAIGLPAQAQNVAPELFVDGDCDQKADWAAQPADILERELDDMLGTEVVTTMTEPMARQVVKLIESLSVTDQWFAGTCEFSEAQLAAMAPLKDAYVRHMARKFGL